MKKHLYILGGIPKRIAEDYKDMIRDDIILLQGNNEYCARLYLTTLQALKIRIQMFICNMKLSCNKFTLTRGGGKRFRVK